MKNIEGDKDYSYLLGLIKVRSSNIKKEYLTASYCTFNGKYEELVNKFIYKNIDEGLN